MMASNKFIIRCKTERGSFIIENVNSESTVQELKIHLADKIGLAPESIRVLCGYPPRALPDKADSLKLKDVNIHSGETIIVEKKNAAEPGVAIEQAAQNEVPPQVERPIMDAAGAYDDLSSGIMMRHVVPSNNSCLFASVYFSLSNGDLNPEKSLELRRLIARVVSENPEKYTTAFLGMSNRDYCTWITDIDHWGGGIELAILSEHFRIEIVSVDVKTLIAHRFGENFNYANRIFLLYDGVHYDPLILERENAPNQTIFPVHDELPFEMVLEVAREALSSKQYTDVANFTLRCITCNTLLRGEKDARDHALATGHQELREV